MSFLASHVNIVMQMLLDRHSFQYWATVPWPAMAQEQLDWISGIQTVENWLNNRIGPRLKDWAWHDSQQTYRVGVAFKWDQDRLLFVIAWT